MRPLSSRRPRVSMMNEWMNEWIMQPEEEQESKKQGVSFSTVSLLSVG